VDVDRFKTINDKYGHVMGDAALTGIAATLLGAVRSGDLVARWGGDEFAVLVEASDEEGLRGTAERIRALVAQSQVRFEGSTITAHVSAGGCLANRGDTPETLLARADQALYAAKDAGRNRISIATSESITRAQDAASGG
jgi:diguanylate cyclase (GGDEF)-like protein